MSSGDGTPCWAYLYFSVVYSSSEEDDDDDEPALYRHLHRRSASRASPST